MCAQTVVELLDKIRVGFGETLERMLFDESGRIRSTYVLLVNGVSVNKLEGVDTRLDEGSTATILFPIEGG